jgi:signal transduction histidine kinase
MVINNQYSYHYYNLHGQGSPVSISDNIGFTLITNHSISGRLVDMGYLTLKNILLVYILMSPLHAIWSQVDSTYLNQLKAINDRIEKGLTNNDIHIRAKAYYDRAKLNFDTPLRNQDIIGDLIESATLYKFLEDDDGYHSARLALAEFYILKEIYLDDAFKLSSEAFRYFNDKNNSLRQLIATKQLGQVYQKKQDYEKAIPYAEQALATSINIQDRHQELDIRLLIIELFGKLGKVENVVEQGLYTIKLEEKYNAKRVSPQVYHTMASYLYKDGQDSKALTYAQLSESLMDSDDLMAIDIYDLLASLYSQQANYEQAYLSAERANNLRQNQYNQEKYALSNQLAVKYQTLERDREIRELEQDYESSETRLFKRTRLFFVLGSMLLLLTGIAVYLYRLQKQKLAAKNLITQQQKEINEQRINELENSLKIKNLQAMVKGQEAERTRIAIDLHDSLGGMLSTLKLQYDSLQVDNNELSKSPEYHKIMKLIDVACKDVRDISRNLKPNALEKLGLSAALGDLINRYNTRGSLEISLHTNEIDGMLEDNAKLHVYRIIQELLNNALKHAQATEIYVQINKTDDHIMLMVEDNGIGFIESEVIKGLGLGNLQSRVNLLRGEISFDSVPKKGTSVIVHIPASTGDKAVINQTESDHHNA